MIQQDMCLWNKDAPGGNKIKLLQNLSMPYILTPPHPRGMLCQWSVSNP